MSPTTLHPPEANDGSRRAVPVVDRDSLAGRPGRRTAQRALDNVGGSGTVLLVQGAAGTGKSDLLAWAGEAAMRRRFRVLSARCDQAEREFPFEAVRQLLEPARRWLSPEDQARIRRTTDRVRPRHTCTAAGADVGGDEDMRSRLSGLYPAIAALSRTRPLLITIDDAQWADVESLRFVELLVKYSTELPLVALLTVRPAAEQSNAGLFARISCHPNTSCLLLAPLSQSATTTLVRAQLGATAPDATCVACHRATGGNPRLLVSLLRYLAGRPRVLDAGEVPSAVPDDVARATLATIARLGTAAASLAGAAAVLCDGGVLGDAAAVAGLSAGNYAAAASALTRAEVLRTGVRVEFVHPIVRESIYQSLPPYARAQAHGHAARVLARRAAPEREVIAHLLKTEPLGERWVLVRLRRAAVDAASTRDRELAVACLKRALRERLPGFERSELLLDLAEALGPSDVSAAIEHCTDAVELAASLRPRHDHTEATRQLVALMLAAGRPAEALEAIETALSSLSAAEQEQSLTLEIDEATIVAANPRFGHRYGGRLERRRAELSGDSILECRALAMLAYRGTQLLTSADEVAKLAELALAGGHLVDDAVESVPLFAVGIALSATERSQAAESLFGAIAARARDGGIRLAFAQSMLRRGVERLHRGALYEATSDIRTALEFARAEQSQLTFQDSLAMLLRVLTERGALAAGEDELRLTTDHGDLAADAQRRSGHDNVLSSWLLGERGRLRLAQKRPREALIDLLAAGRSAPGPPIGFAWRSLAARAHAQLGDQARACELAHADLAQATTWGTPRWHGTALETLGVVEGGKRGIRRLREAVAMLERSDARLQRAGALASLGAALRRDGHPREARTFLRSGLELAVRCGALSTADFAEEELAATGIRRRSRVAAPDDQLTPSERRVAHLAASGLSNPEIAKVLSVSRKTVEMHLRGAYRKLDIDSRHRLGVALQR